MDYRPDGIISRQTIRDGWEAARAWLFGSGGYRTLNPLLGLEDDYAFVFHQTPKESKTARSMLAGTNQTKTRISAQHYIIGQYYYLGDLKPNLQTGGDFRYVV